MGEIEPGLDTIQTPFHGSSGLAQAKATFIDGSQRPQIQRLVFPFSH